jgi:predicted N-acyltransferase
MQTRFYDSVSAIHPNEWSQLDVLSGFSSYRWLQSVERYAARPCTPHYVVAYVQERPVGAIVLELVNDVDRESGIVRRLLGGRRVLRHTFGKYLAPNLVAGTPFGYGGQILIDVNMGITQRSHVVQELLSAAERLSDSLRAPLWFSDVLARDTELINTLRNAGYLSCQYLPLAEIAIEWHTFDDYVDTLKSRYRNHIRREQKRCRAAGVVLEEPTDLSDRDERFVQLANQTYGKHGDLAFPFNAGFFSGLKSNLGDGFQVCNALESDNILGFVTMISDGHTGWAGNYGLDYTNSSSAFVYFNLVLQWPIRKAIELGLKRLVLGRGHYELKMRRGCTLNETYLFRKPPNALSKPIYARLFRMLDRHYIKQAESKN